MPWFQLRRRSDRHGNRQLNAALAELPPWLSAPYLLSGRKHRRRRQVETLRSRLEASADRGSPRREIVWNTFGRARLGIWRTVSASTELQTQVGKTGQANPLILVSAPVIRGAAHDAPAQKEAAMHIGVAFRFGPPPSVWRCLRSSSPARAYPIHAARGRMMRNVTST